jgi:putative NIF3 family GTP cyclohydrolase 1 type 2
MQNMMYFSKGVYCLDKLSNIIDKLDKLFRLDEFDVDPSFCRFFPITYSSVDFDWRSYFEGEYLRRFNGIMIRGDEEVGAIFCSVTPTEEVLNHFIEKSLRGDLLLLHHPVDCENGDPKGSLGRGLIPMSQEQLDKIREKGLSVYSCHIPMDINPEVGTGIALVKALKGTVRDVFLPMGYGHDGLIFEVRPISTQALIDKLEEVLEIPYVDFNGKEIDTITRIAFIPGMGGHSELMEEAESKGAQVYISGEILCRLNDDYGRSCFKSVSEYIPKTTMSLIGTSHDGSEALTMRTLMRDWVEANFNVKTEYISLGKWWR